MLQKYTDLKTDMKAADFYTNDFVPSRFDRVAARRQAPRLARSHSRGGSASSVPVTLRAVRKVYSSASGEVECARAHRPRHPPAGASSPSWARPVAARARCCS